MEDELYQYCIAHARENPFRQYMDFLHEMGELSAEEETVYDGIDREFLSLIETTDMQKVYKMPVLYSFYNHRNVRLAVTEELSGVVTQEAFQKHMKDILDYRTMEYYRRRYYADAGEPD